MNEQQQKELLNAATSAFDMLSSSPPNAESARACLRSALRALGIRGADIREVLAAMPHGAACLCPACRVARVSP